MRKRARRSTGIDLGGRAKRLATALTKPQFWNVASERASNQIAGMFRICGTPDPAPGGLSLAPRQTGGAVSKRQVTYTP